MAEPSKSTLYDPAPWQQLETFLGVAPQDHSQGELEPVGDPFQQGPAVAAIHPDAAQLLARPGQAPEQLFGAVAVR